MSPPPKNRAGLLARATQALSPKAPAGSKVGMTDLGSRAIAQAQAPSPMVGTGANRTQAYTYVTKVGGQPEVLYNGDRLWAKVRLTLETGGPVVVGQQSKLAPITSGIGSKLITNQEREFTIAKGTRLYIFSTAINRVSVTVEPLPWLEQITALLEQIASKFGF